MATSVKLIEIFMIVVYSVMGLLFIFTDLLKSYVTNYREVSGGLMLAYAAYRAFLIWKRLQNEKDSESQNKQT